jgi:hypothetical protein
MVCVLLFSCDSNTRVQADTIAPEPEEEVIKEQEETKEQEISIEQDTVKKVFEQASNGLEYKVVLYYKELYQTGELRSVVDGMPVKMKPGTNTVCIETELFSNNSLGFFEGKYPEFIDPPENQVALPNSSLLENKAINCVAFKDVRAIDFLKSRNKHAKGDLLLLISKTFFFDGAYYVHAWSLSTDPTLFHYKQCTFKFDKSSEIVDSSCANYYQISYKSADQFINSLKVNLQH